MATITERKKMDGTISYTAQIRLKRGGKIVYQQSETFNRRALARAWADRREAELQRPGALEQIAPQITIAELIHKTVEHLETIRPLGRTKRFTLLALAETELAETLATELTAPALVEHCRLRALAGCAPPTVLNDVIHLRAAYQAGRSMFGLPLNLDAIAVATTQLRALGWVGKSRERERRPTADELERLRAYFSRQSARSVVTMVDIMEFAIASCRRLAEISELCWADIRESDHTGVVRDLKHPRHKNGNDRRFKLLREAWEIVERQPRRGERVFPFEPKTIGTAWQRACKLLEIADLHFHDLRHHGISLLFERGYSIQEVQLITLHESWSTLKRYTHLKPGDLTERG